MRRFIVKKKQLNKKPYVRKYNYAKQSTEEVKTINEPVVVEKKQKENKEIEKPIKTVMDTKEKIEIANLILTQEQPKVKKIKKDKELIERTESSISILTEDNRELLKD